MAQSIEGFVGKSMDNARLSPIHYRVFTLIAAGYFFDVADYVILGSLIPDMTAQRLRLRGEIATVGSATLFGMFLGTLVQGEFTDRFGRKTVYQFNLLLYGIATIAAAFSPDYVWLAALRFIAGIGLGAEQPLCFAYAGEYAPKAIRGRFIAGVQLIGGAFVWPMTTLFALDLSPLAWLARLLDRHRHLRPDRLRVPLHAAGVAALARHPRSGKARARVAGAHGHWPSARRHDVG